MWAQIIGVCHHTIRVLKSRPHWYEIHLHVIPVLLKLLNRASGLQSGVHSFDQVTCLGNVWGPSHLFSGPLSIQIDICPQILLLLWVPTLWLSLYNQLTDLPGTLANSLWLPGSCWPIISPLLCFAFLLENHVGPPWSASHQVRKLQETMFWVPHQKPRFLL